MTNVVVSACSPLTSRAMSASTLPATSRYCCEVAAGRVPGLVEVRQVHDEKLRIGRLGDAQRIVHERAREVAALRPRPQRHGRPGLDAVELGEVGRPDDGDPSTASARGVDERRRQERGPRTSWWSRR